MFHGQIIFARNNIKIMRDENENDKSSGIFIFSKEYRNKHNNAVYNRVRQNFKSLLMKTYKVIW